jgi:hypothetical protein
VKDRVSTPGCGCNAKDHPASADNPEYCRSQALRAADRCRRVLKFTSQGIAGLPGWWTSYAKAASTSDPEQATGHQRMLALFGRTKAIVEVLTCSVSAPHGSPPRPLLDRRAVSARRW